MQGGLHAAQADREDGGVDVQTGVRLLEVDGRAEVLAIAPVTRRWSVRYRYTGEPQRNR